MHEPAREDCASPVGELRKLPLRRVKTHTPRWSIRPFWRPCLAFWVLAALFAPGRLTAESDRAFLFAVLGDTPYMAFEEVRLEKLIGAMNAADLAIQQSEDVDQRSAAAELRIADGRLTKVEVRLDSVSLFRIAPMR